jgi:cyanophycin synthetase
MQASNARRLTGPSWWLDAPGAAVEVAFANDDVPAKLFAVWCARVAVLAGEIGWPRPLFGQSVGAACATWAFTAPIDQLTTAADVAEAACGVAALQPAHWQLLARTEANPQALAWIAHAETHDLPWLLDEEGLTLGLGNHGRTWPLAEVQETLPDVRGLARIPHVLITGTNGKTTTARIVARILREHGLFAGNTSTDGLMLNGELVTPGDWTGPGGARQVLRNTDVQAAALETARGGLLRRGLATTWADAAVVTNVSDDHLDGQVPDVDAMAEMKLAIRKGIRPGGLLVLNWDCEPLVNAVWRLQLWKGPHRLAWFALSDDGLDEAPGPFHAFAARHGLVVNGDLPDGHAFGDFSDIPLTFGGAAKHNVANCLAAVLLAHAVGVPRWTIIRGLAHFRSSVADNPGRANVLHLNGATILVDFAHNPDGVRQVAALVADWPSTSRTLLIGQAGDRTDDLMHAFVRESLALRPDRVVLKDTDHYLRGRQKHEIPEVLQRFYLHEGVPQAAITVTDDEPAGIVETLKDAQPGHLLILLVHDDFPHAIAQLRAAGAVEP